MSYTFLQEQEEESLAESFSDIPAYVLSRLNLTAEKSYSKGKETDYSLSSRSGTMLEPSTVNRGADLSMSCAEGSPARTLLSEARPQQESTASEADCGPKCVESLAKWNQHSFSWKTAQQSLFGGLESFSGNWPRDHRSRWVEMARAFSRMDDVVADRVAQAEAIGNGQVPAVVKLAWETLSLVTSKP